MLHSSLGFHTLTLFLFLTWKEMEQLLKDFKKYSKETGLIKIFTPDPPKKVRRKVIERGKARFIKEVKANYTVDYYKADRGIEWTIRYNNWSTDFQSYIIEVTINPKILGGVEDYITAATYADMAKAITNFNLEAKSISPLLRHFGCYCIKRVDYCINFDLEEIMTISLPESVMNLIRRADIPPHYEEWKKKRDKSHEKKSDPASFYLTNESLHINCYSKYMQLQNLSEERVKKGLDPIPQEWLDAARNIIRFEVQCKYRKTYALSAKAMESGNLDFNKYESLLIDDACHDAINYYFNKVIGKGDWYTLQAATRKIEACNFNKQHEQRLIEALQLVNRCRSVATAKASYQGRDLETFKQTSKELSRLGINPVTIPKEWGVKHIPNLLYTYYDLAAEERQAKFESEARFEMLDGFMSKQTIEFLKKQKLG